jgi:hypothetical protein
VSNIRYMPKSMQPNHHLFHFSQHIGHFTQIVTGAAFQVGCGMSQFIDGQRKWSLFCCNYARTNLIGTPVYLGGPPASRCGRGQNPKYSGLCRAEENFYPDLPLLQSEQSILQSEFCMQRKLFCKVIELLNFIRIKFSKFL